MVKFTKMFSKKKGLKDDSMIASMASKTNLEATSFAPSVKEGRAQELETLGITSYASEDGTEVVSTKQDEGRQEHVQHREDCEPESDREDEEASEEVMSVEEEHSVASSTYENDERTFNTYGDDTAIENRGTSAESFEENDITRNDTYDGSLAASEAAGDQKKFFHKDVVLHHFGENGQTDNLVIRAMYFVPKPKSPDHVVVRIEASTVTARDVTACRGLGLKKMTLPFVPGFELVGTVQAMGEHAKIEGFFQDGDRVACISNFGGGNSRFISIPASRLIKIPDTVKSTHAVCMLHDYMAALKALRLSRRNGSPFTGMNILITDGFSAIGQAIITLANLEGANIYCTADESKHTYLATLGAKCFPMEPEAWLPSASGTFDVVIDNTCLDSYSSSWFALNKKGTLVCIAPVYHFERHFDNGCGILDLKELHNRWAALKAKYVMTQTAFVNVVNEYEEDPDQYKQDLRYLMLILERGVITPKIAEKVCLEDVPDAQRLLYSGKSNGTIVCVPWIDN